VLGLLWDRETDSFIYKTNPAEQENEKKMTTMRLLLSAFSRLFDPLGFADPFIITPRKARIQYQEL